MNDENNQNREHDLREKIASLIQANEQALKTRITDDELQKLNAAASRLDQMLTAGADAERQALRSAAARLDQLLQDIRAGKDVDNCLKRHKSVDASTAS